MKTKVSTYVRMAALAISLVYTLICAIVQITGDSNLVVMANQAVSILLTVVTSVLNCWKNNSMTVGAIAGDQVMEAINSGAADVEQALSGIKDLVK